MATVLLFVVRGYVVRQYALVEDIPTLDLHRGDRVLVLLLDRHPRIGQSVAFRLHEKIYFDTPLALPGDTLWISPTHRTLLHHQLMPTDEPLILPRHGDTITVTPRNASLIAKALCRYEDVRTDLTPEGKLLLRGQNVTAVTFTHDFYWMRDISPSEGFIASSDIVGRFLGVSYSLSTK